MIKNLPDNGGDVRDSGSIPGGEGALQKAVATHSGILAWRISCTEEAGGLQSMGSQRVGHDQNQSSSGLQPHLIASSEWLCPPTKFKS